MVLPKWNELPTGERRSLRRLYERIRNEVNGDESPSPETTVGDEPIGNNDLDDEVDDDV